MKTIGSFKALPFLQESLRFGLNICPQNRSDPEYARHRQLLCDIQDLTLAVARFRLDPCPELARIFPEFEWRYARLPYNVGHHKAYEQVWDASYIWASRSATEFIRASFKDGPRNRLTIVFPQAELPRRWPLWLTAQHPQNGHMVLNRLTDGLKVYESVPGQGLQQVDRHTILPNA
jgi:hypothetical protein